jgi:hypothetical protein
MNNIIKEDLVLSTIRLSTEKQTKKHVLLFPILGVLVTLAFFMLAFYIISRMKGRLCKT